MLRISCLGALIAALYGVVHDEVTYTISTEYFTVVKFRQFHYADFGFPVRVFVAEIGALATWWVGFAGGWFMARTLTADRLATSPLPWVLRGFAIMLGCAFVAGVIGYGYGSIGEITTGNSDLAATAASIGVKDIPAFVRVAYIHNAGYLGGLIGLIVAIVILRRKMRRAAALEKLRGLPSGAGRGKE